MTIGKDEKNTNYTLKDQKLQKVMEEKDIGVTIDDQLYMTSHISEKINVTGYQIASLGFSHCEIQGFYRAGKFNYFLSNNATVDSRMLHQCLT